jgi:anti-sigma B factor antagonist
MSENHTGRTVRRPCRYQKMTLTMENFEDVTVVEVPGAALDSSISSDFKTAASSLMKPGAKVVFDLTRTRFVDSMGLGVIVSCLRQVHAVQGELKLCGMNNAVRTLFELVRMHRVFEIFNTREEAVRSFNI